MSDAPCPVCNERSGDMFSHLKATHPHDDWGAYSTRNPTTDGRVSIGLGRRIAYALSIWPTNHAPRPLIRAMLPERGRKGHTAQRHVGRTSAGENRTSRQFQERLRQYEAAGLISRGAEYIKIEDRGRLSGIALEGVRDDRVEFLAIERAVQPAREAVRAAVDERARRRRVAELQAVYDLMKADLGIHYSGRRSVRHVPHGWRGRPS